MADLASLRALRERVRAQNQDLTDDEANDWSDRFVIEAFEGLVASGAVRFAVNEPDNPEGAGDSGAA